jgi:hypothetical protein
MGLCNSKFTKKDFINETIYKLKRNNIIIRDENDEIISENEIKLTLEGMFKRQSIHYYKNLRCKPKMLELFVPNWWKF